MDKTSLLELKKKMFLRSALIPIDNLDELLSLNDYFSGDEVFYELIAKAKQEFEYYEPLITEFLIYPCALHDCTCPPGAIKITDNFQQYLDCIIPETQIRLVPNSTPKLRIGNSFEGYNSYYGSFAGVPMNYVLPNNYEKPYLYLSNLISTDSLWMRSTYNRPMHADWTVDKKLGPKSYIYYLDINSGVRGQMFLDQCMIELLNYIRSLKANFQLPNFPIDIFAAVDSLYQELKSSLDNRYLQSGWRGELLV